MWQWPERYEEIIRIHCRFVESSQAVDPDENLAVLGVDSMELISIIVDLEEAFGFQMPQELLVPENFATPRTLWRALEAHVGL